MGQTKSALIIANYQYSHPGLRQLMSPAQDAESLARVLGDAAICGFEVRTVINEPSFKVTLEIENFCENRTRDDLLILYFSGHGIKDSDGQLYFATIDTQLVQENVRRATAVPAYFVNREMTRSRSRRQILLLDCCYSGAFRDEMLTKGGERVGATEQLEGQGRIVLTASDAFQYSFEGGQVHGTGLSSVFTRALVYGLETGEADLDRDGLFSLDEVYDYVYAKVLEVQPEQKPTKLGYVEGKLFIGSNPRPVASQLPSDLQESVDDRRHWVRLGAVEELSKLLSVNNKGLSMAAWTVLTSLAEHDDSMQVREAARSSLRQGPKSPVSDIQITTQASWYASDLEVGQRPVGTGLKGQSAEPGHSGRIAPEAAPTDVFRASPSSAATNTLFLATSRTTEQTITNDDLIDDFVGLLRRYFERQPSIKWALLVIAIIGLIWVVCFLLSPSPSQLPPENEGYILFSPHIGDRLIEITPAGTASAKSHGTQSISG